jgi:hypothetical protein
VEKLPKLHPQPLPDSGEYAEREWQELLDNLVPETVPLSMLKVLRVTLDDENETSLVFPVKQWVEEGTPIAKIEVYINSWMEEHEDTVKSTDFILDFEELKEVVITETQKALKNL